MGVSEAIEIATDRYPASWRVGDAWAGGVLVLGDDGFRLEGRCAGRERIDEVGYDAIERVRVGRLPSERIDGRRSIVIERRGLPDLLVEPHGLGVLGELADTLTALSLEARADTTVTVVVPLRPGAAEKARALLAEGPPFDPAAFEIAEHTVAITEREAVFSFSGPGVRALLDRGARDPSLWRAGLAWRSVIAGKPRIAETMYSWRR
jgi:hypothetical protein